MIWSLITLTLFLAIFLSSCVSTSPVFYSNNTNYDFVILGIVTYEGSGNTGFQDIMQAAKIQYPNADYIIDIMIDRKVTQFLFFKIESTKFTMRATAIQYIRRNINGEIITDPTPTSIPNSQILFNSVIESSDSVTSDRTNVQKDSHHFQITANSRLTVISVTGNVRRVISGQSANPLIRVNNVLTANTRITMTSSSTLVLTDGSKNYTITGRSGRIIDIIN